MKKQVLDFVRTEIENGNQVIIATMGNGGAGLTMISDESLISDLEEMDYVDGLAEAEDIEDFEDYAPSHYRVHRFDGENGYYVLVATYMDDVTASIPNAVVTEDSEYYFIDLKYGVGVGFYPKSDWTLEDAIEDQKNVFSENRGF